MVPTFVRLRLVYIFTRTCSSSYFLILTTILPSPSVLPEKNALEAKEVEVEVVSQGKKDV